MEQTKFGTYISWFGPSHFKICRAQSWPCVQPAQVLCARQRVSQTCCKAHMHHSGRHPAGELGKRQSRGMGCREGVLAKGKRRNVYLALVPDTKPRPGRGQPYMGCLDLASNFVGTSPSSPIGSAGSYLGIRGKYALTLRRPPAASYTALDTEQACRPACSCTV